MNKGRLEAFSDGVIAILITIMVLDLKTPQGSEWPSLQPLAPMLASYVMSFVVIGLYWNNHHHMLQATDRVNGKVLWANLHLLFWLSLLPFVTRWTGETRFAPLPTAAYGFILILSAVAYTILQNCLIAAQGRDSKLALAVGNNMKGKLSLALYAVGVVVALRRPWFAGVVYFIVALIWLVPDRRIESRLNS